MSSVNEDKRGTNSFRHEREKSQEDDARNISVPAALLAALHAAQAEQVLADDAGERVPGAVSARLQVGQDDLAGRLRRWQDLLGQQVREPASRARIYTEVHLVQRTPVCPVTLRYLMSHALHILMTGVTPKYEFWAGNG